MDGLTTVFKSKKEQSNSILRKDENGDEQYIKLDATEFPMSDRVWGQDQSELQVQMQLQKQTNVPINIRAVETEEEQIIFVETSEMAALSKDLNTLSEIAQDMSQLLDVQGEQIDKIEKNVDESTHDVMGAGVKVEETLRIMRKTKYKKGALTTTACAVTGGAIGMVGGPIGIAVGAGIGATVGMVGSTITSFI